jgi:uncharacterized protein (TIGR00730 family)
MRAKSICVFCGSNEGRQDLYRSTAQSVGRQLAQSGIQVVFGGGSCGLMGAVADAALEAGGRVVGVIPKGIESREVAHRSLSELHIVRSMHDRKAMMTELSDGFLALPGGLGTLEELFEVLSWAQLGIHEKPVALLNAGGYFDPLLTFLDRSMEEGFVRPEHHALLLRGDDVEEVLAKMKAYEPTIDQKWLDLDEG